MDPDYFDLDGPSISAVDVAEAGAEWVIANDGGADGQADYFVDDAVANYLDFEGGADGQVHDLNSGSQIVAAYPDVNSFEHDLSGIRADYFGLDDVIDAGSGTGNTRAAHTHLPQGIARHAPAWGKELATRRWSNRAGEDNKYIIRLCDGFNLLPPESRRPCR